MHRRRKNKPAGRGNPPARSTLDSQQLPTFKLDAHSGLPPPSRTFRVPSPATSDDESEAEALESDDPSLRLPDTSGSRGTTFPTDISFVTISDDSERLANLGDSSSLFDSGTPERPKTFGAVVDRQEPFKFSGSGTTIANPFLITSSSPSIMVVEREPPKATPQKPVQQVSRVNGQPEFGKPSPLHNRLQPQNIFNAPKQYQQRPEHHRPAPAPKPLYTHPTADAARKFEGPSRSSQPVQTRPIHASADSVQILRPENPPTFNTYPRPQPLYSSMNPPSTFTSVNSYQRPIDLTKSQDSVYHADPALQNDRFGAVDPFLYVDAGKATENIKALLEGAFDDYDEKPRTRGRKKKLESNVEDLAKKVSGLGVQSDNNVKEDAQNHDDEAELDDLTVEGLEANLLPHQIDGVEWMKHTEIGTVKKNGTRPKGGILADDARLTPCPK